MRLHRCASSESASFHGFAGLHFMPSGKLLAAARSSSGGAELIDCEAMGPTITRSIPCAIQDGSSELLTATPLDTDGGDLVLLLHNTGQVLLWDVRTPTPIPILDLEVAGGDMLQATTVDTKKW